MKKNDILKKTVLKPKKQIIDFLLNYSKSIEVVKCKTRTHILIKN